MASVLAIHGEKQILWKLQRSSLMEKVQKKPTETERKWVRRKLIRNCRDHLANQMGANDSITVLAENQSLNSYKRLRLSLSFEAPRQTKERYKKCTPRENTHHSLTKCHGTRWSSKTWKLGLKVRKLSGQSLQGNTKLAPNMQGKSWKNLLLR